MKLTKTWKMSRLNWGLKKPEKYFVIETILHNDPHYKWRSQFHGIFSKNCNFSSTVCTMLENEKFILTGKNISSNQLFSNFFCKYARYFHEIFAKVRVNSVISTVCFNHLELDENEKKIIFTLLSDKKGLLVLLFG